MLDDTALAKLYPPPPEPEAAPAPATDAAGALYGTTLTDSPDPADEGLEATTTDEKAEALYGDPEPPPNVVSVPDNIRALREGDPDRKVYSPQSAYNRVLEDGLLDPLDGSPGNLPPEARPAVVAELREIAADLGLAPTDVELIRTRAGMARTTPVKPEAAIDDAVTQMNAAFGQDAKRAWLDARALVARDPRVAKLIEGLGLGNDGRTLVAIAQAARRQRAAGRLK